MDGPAKAAAPWAACEAEWCAECRTWEALLLPLLLEEVATLYLKKSSESASPGQPEPVEIHRDFGSLTTDWGKGCWDQGQRNSWTHHHCHIFFPPWKAVRGSVVCLDYLPQWQEISLYSKMLMTVQRAKPHLRETGCWQARVWVIKTIFKIVAKVFFSRNLNTMREIKNAKRDDLPLSHLLTWTSVSVVAQSTKGIWNPVQISVGRNGALHRPIISSS